MTHSLQSLFQAIATARNENELRLQVMDRVSEYFVAPRWVLFFFDQLCFAKTIVE